MTTARISPPSLGLATALAALIAGPAQADPSYQPKVSPGFEPYVTADFSLELESDATFEADDPAAELTDSYATVEAELAAYISQEFSLHAALTFEPALDAEDDRFFEDHGLYVSEIYARWTMSDSFSLIGGKIAPAFAIAWDAAPGLYGTGFAEDYELAEQIGVAAEWKTPFGENAPTLSVALVAADTTALSDSIFQDRGDLDRDDGGAGNTGSLENVVVSLDGEALGFGYAIGGRRLGAGEGDPEDELGGSFGLTRDFELGEGRSLSLLGEAAYFANAGGAPEDALYLTGAAAYGIDAFTLSASYTLRDVEAADADHLATASIEYEVAPGFGLGAGYSYAEEATEGAHTVGVLATYEFGLSSGPEE